MKKNYEIPNSNFTYNRTNSISFIYDSFSSMVKEEKLIEKNLFPIKARIISNKSNPMSAINYYIAQDKRMEYGIGIDSLRGEIIISIL